jgi:hypothetical protein
LVKIHTIIIILIIFKASEEEKSIKIMKITNLTSYLLKEIDNCTEYKIQTLMIKYSSKINSIKYITGTLIAVIVIFFVFVFLFDIINLCQTVQWFKKTDKPKLSQYVDQNQNVFRDRLYKSASIDIDRKYLEFIKSNNKKNNY